MSFAFYRQITIDHLQVPATLTDFPFPISLTFNDLRTVGNGGDVTDAQADDLVFATDNNGASLLKWEVQSYNPVTGAIKVFVTIPSLSSVSDVIIYAVYGDAGVTTFQGDVAGTWNSGHNRVWHCEDNTASSAIEDSTGNNIDGAFNTGNSSAYTVAGKIDKGFAVAGQFAQSAVSGSPSAVTLSGWLKTSAAVTQYFLSSINTSTPFPGFVIAVNGQGPFDTFHDGRLSAWCGDLVGGYLDFDLGAGAISDGNWHLIGMNYAGGTVKIFFDGAEVASASRTGSLDNNGILVMVENFTNGTLTGSFDEIRFETVARDANWFAVRFISENDPAAGMITVGSQTATSDPNIDLVFSDSLSLSDSQVLLGAGLLSFTDALALSDSIGDVPATVNLPFSDTLSLSDAMALTVGIELSFSDTLSLSDATALLMAINLAIVEALALSDNSSFVGTISREASDLLVLSDDIELHKTYLMAITEQISLSDFQQLLLTMDMSLADTLVLVDAVTVTLSAFAALGQSFSDTLSLSDSISILLGTSYGNYIRRYLNDVTLDN